MPLLYTYFTMQLCAHLVDKRPRLEFAQLLEMLKNKEIDIDTFEGKYFKILEKSKGDSMPDAFLIKDIFSQVWQLYDDLSDDYLRQDNLTISKIDRCVCFLKSDLRYEWPRFSRAGRGVLNFITFGVFSVIIRRRAMRIGDLNAWPFLSEDDFEKSKMKYKCK